MGRTPRGLGWVDREQRARVAWAGDWKELDIQLWVFLFVTGKLADPILAGGHRQRAICMSAGLKVLAQKIPEGLVTGSFPVSCQVAAPSGSARKKTSPKVPPACAENKWRFSADDLQKIKYYLEEEHFPSDTASKTPGQMLQLLSVALEPALQQFSALLCSLRQMARRGRGFSKLSEKIHQNLCYGDRRGLEIWHSYMMAKPWACWG